jgi:pyruvate/2-oxoglutarate dehydrogenase complex dihydrolipoamide acyltransferase (E2) component
VRSVPAKLLIDNRVVINNHLARSRGGKVSFTHIIGFALVKALKALPEMNHAFGEQDGKPVVIAPRTSTSAWPSTWPSPTAPASCSSRRSSRPS